MPPSIPHRSIVKIDNINPIILSIMPAIAVPVSMFFLVTPITPRIKAGIANISPAPKQQAMHTDRMLKVKDITPHTFVFCGM